VGALPHRHGADPFRELLLAGFAMLQRGHAVLRRVLLPGRAVLRRRLLRGLLRLALLLPRFAVLRRQLL
jgi:hypothetical protein